MTSKSRPLDELDSLMSPEALVQAKHKARAIVASIRLSELRDNQKLTQADMAKLMHVKQPTISNLENSSAKAKLETIQRYVAAMGGEMSIDVRMPDGTHFELEI
ncbi:helix-turn-helix transcriptional regulator [Vibrio sp. 99-8-1]|uniref:helix-turn-helix domain-containing protein n=1 Tax=Vibrio sp. 99-8-1 TaxID=2607602 RepID=UPI00149374CA|nr:helix-turn-helix transcriptional regulator [Vibrio sp. 99-8-1]NOI65069.1 helix-turn-helix transcriptional regulator [Vibrio sp. 99-8-1]